MNIYIFTCDYETFGKCVSHGVFAAPDNDRTKKMASRMRPNDLCCLYNYTDRQLYGVWQATSELKIQPLYKSWAETYPFQVSVKPYSDVYTSVPRSRIEELAFGAADSKGKRWAKWLITGEAVEQLLQLLLPRQKSQDEENENRYPHQYRCNDGHIVKSLSEKSIDDWLANRKIFHAYEPDFPFGDKIEPDFLVYSTGGSPVYIEFWGRMDKVDYRENRERKEKIYTERGFQLIEVFPPSLGNLDMFMSESLRKHGVIK
jgi:hypothetical protein